MTFIIGLNLSDRIYLAGDTRVTHSDGQYSDDALKLSPLLNRAVFAENEIGIAVAGNVALATFFKNEISTALNNRQLNPDIRKFYDEIKPFLEEKIVDWVNAGNKYVNCCLLFGGLFKGRKKHINLIKLQELVVEYEAKNKRDETSHTKAAFQLKDDPIFKILDQKIKEGTGIGALEHLEKSKIPHIPEEIKNAIDSGLGEIEYPDSLIFSAKIEIATKNVQLESAEWGEFLAYGDRVKKEMIPQGLLAMLELHYGKQEKTFTMESAILTNTILDYAKDLGIGTIGGTVIIMPIDKDGAHITGKDIIFQPGNTHVKINGIPVSLVPFFYYHKKRKAAADLVAKMG